MFSLIKKSINIVWNNKIVVLSLILLLLVILAIGLERLDLISYSNEDISKPDVITVCEISEYYENEDIIVDIHRPKISGFSDKAFEKLLNKKIENLISTYKTNAELCSLRSNYFCYFSTNFWVKSSEGIYSLKVTTDLSGFWITNLPVTEYYNIDIANNRLLILDNLFIDRSYQERLKAY